MLRCCQVLRVEKEYLLLLHIMTTNSWSGFCINWQRQGETLPWFTNQQGIICYSPGQRGHWTSMQIHTMWCKKDSSNIKTTLQQAGWKEEVMKVENTCALYCWHDVVYTCKWCMQICNSILINLMNTIIHVIASAKCAQFSNRVNGHYVPEFTVNYK